MTQFEFISFSTWPFFSFCSIVLLHQGCFLLRYTLKQSYISINKSIHPYVPYSKKQINFSEFGELQHFAKFFANFYNFHNVPYANGLQFTKVFFCQTSYSSYSPNLFTTKIFYCTVSEGVVYM